MTEVFYEKCVEGHGYEGGKPFLLAVDKNRIPRFHA